jgi:putative Ca2+/H+ antiporter (TMEM165/GDT1 family)
VSAIIMWRKHDEEPAAEKDGGQVGFAKAFTMSFMVVFVVEWGDLTQIATAGFAAHSRQPVLVFCAATAALWAVATIAVILGHRAKHLIKPKIVQRVAAVLFALVGVALMTGIL